MAQSGRNISYENVKMGEKNHSFSTNPATFPEVNAMIEEWYPKWEEWQRKSAPHLKVDKASFYRYLIIRGIFALEGHMKEVSNVAA